MASNTLIALQILQIASKFSVYSSYITFTLGIIGNLIDILVFTNVKLFRNNRCIFYLTIESISNFISLLFTGTLTLFITIYGTTLVTTSLVWCRLVYLLSHSMGLITFSMICLLASDQYISTNYRLNLRQVCTFRLARYLVFISVFICFLHGITCSLFVNIVPSVGCIVTNAILIKYFTYFFYPVLTGFLPIVTVSLFGLFAFRNVRHHIRLQATTERRRMDRQITAMVLTRIVFFVLFTFPYITFRIYNVNVVVSQTDLLQFAIIQLVQTIIFSFAALNNSVRYYFCFHSYEFH